MRKCTFYNGFEASPSCAQATLSLTALAVQRSGILNPFDVICRNTMSDKIKLYFLLGQAEIIEKSNFESNNMAELLFSGPWAAEPIQLKEIILFLSGWASENRSQGRRPEMEPEMDQKLNPKRDPKPSLFGGQESSKTLCFPCVLANIGPRRGPKNDPKMEPKTDPEMIRDWLPGRA